MKPYLIGPGFAVRCGLPICWAAARADVKLDTKNGLSVSLRYDGLRISRNFRRTGINLQIHLIRGKTTTILY